MLEDDKLIQMLRDAHEVNAFEKGESFDDLDSIVVTEPAPLRLSETSRAPSGGSMFFGGTRRWLAPLGIAATVAVVAGVFVVSQPPRLAPASGGPRAVSTASNQPVVSDSLSTPRGVEASSTVLMAIMQDDAGKLDCVRWSGEILKGRALAEVSDDELRAMGMNLLCTDQSRRLLVVGMQGPTVKLPQSDSTAREIASCMLGAPACASDAAFNPAHCASSGCIDAQVNIRVRQVAVR